ncbi:MAG: winged helix-turn-helix transcriptional regulator [Bacteroidaceae bacterium]|nr:winged helix-turn-helix transcriptional regulator [Bacteroidaceae bacterium]
MDRNGFIYFNTRLSPKNSGKADSYPWAIMILDEVLPCQDVTDLKENGNQPAEFNVNLITAFKVEVKVSQSYTNEAGGKTGGKVGGDVVENIAGNITENIVDSIVEKLSTTRAKIVRIIWKNPNATALSISKEIDIASRNVQEHLRKLQEQGVIRRIGPDKGGHWEIIAP